MVNVFSGIFCLLIILGFEPPLLNQSFKWQIKEVKAVGL